MALCFLVWLTQPLWVGLTCAAPLADVAHVPA
jgi:hypothetical protein